MTKARFLVLLLVYSPGGGGGGGMPTFHSQLGGWGCDTFGRGLFHREAKCYGDDEM